MRARHRRKPDEPIVRPDFVIQYDSGDGKVQVAHRGGVAWYDYPLPPRDHECWAQTEGWLSYFNRYLRCACGATSENGRFWIEKNQTRNRSPEKDLEFMPRHRRTDVRQVRRALLR